MQIDAEWASCTEIPSAPLFYAETQANRRGFSLGIECHLAEFQSDLCIGSVGIDDSLGSQLHIVVADNQDVPIAVCCVSWELHSYLMEQSRRARVLV